MYGGQWCFSSATNEVPTDWSGWQLNAVMVSDPFHGKRVVT